MIQSVGIKNFKSIVDLTIELGSFNVLIGENGCGKSNILEAIAFGAAASADKLDFEFLGSRGIRVTNPEFMVSAFSSLETLQTIVIDFNIDNDTISYRIVNDPTNKKRWLSNTNNTFLLMTNNLIAIKKDINEGKSADENVISKVAKIEEELNFLIKNTSLFPQKINLSNYVIYSPEQSSLRKFEETNQIYPLGIKGEGLFQYLKELAFDENNKPLLDEIRENMMLLDWYEDFDLPENLMKNEFALRIKDKYLNENLQYFDQRSTNEGFLFLLFYSTLFISKGTPSFFAIDNIDASFNPKLCMQLTRNLAALAKKHNKQVIVTTHNPAILDGLNLQDDEQRLFVVRRNEEGHTKANRIPYKAEREKKLSEIWTNGFIGGLPENF